MKIKRRVVLKMKESKKVLTSKDITAMAYRSAFLQASFNYERMQAGGWTVAMLPALEKIYKDDKQGLAAAMTDNMQFINTHPTLVPFLMTLLLSLEENGSDRNLIKGIKVGLFGPLAGIGDAIFWFTVLPIMAGISSSFALEGNVIGPILFFLVYVGIFLMRFPLAKAGYELGTTALDSLRESSKKLSRAATILGTTVIGALAAAYVHITLLPTITINEGVTISIQTAFIDKIFPNLLPLAYVFTMFYFIRVKKVSPTILILVTIVLTIVLSFLGIL
jgi:PTS system galactosamine-specific IID component